MRDVMNLLDDQKQVCYDFSFFLPEKDGHETT